ncbi:hypothetical protein GGS21DRAFT_119356 [Xylaria nigripes]|nr:hypothetical protein GGS21DRAFT_119356 [Xylaria nigripes]
MPNSLSLLRTNAILHPTCPQTPYHRISVRHERTACKITIAATKPLPSRLLNGGPLDPNQYVQIFHSDICTCAFYAKCAVSLFNVWQILHIRLRYGTRDLASAAFYPVFEYAEGEAIAHASLTASLAVGKQVPDCYRHLVSIFGAPPLRHLVRAEMAAAGNEGERVRQTYRGPLTYD